MLASVILPTRNRREKLQACLHGLSGQTSGDFEILVVNDGSDDDTQTFLDSFEINRDDVVLRVLQHRAPRGANPSRNRAIGESRGEFLAFIDDDCVPQSTWLSNLLKVLADPAVGAVTGNVENVPARNLYELTLKGTQRVHGREGDATRLVGCNMAVRRTDLLANLLDEDRAGPSPDMSVSGRGDEEGLYLTLKAQGRRVRVARDAVVLHDHPYSRGAFVRQAWRSGRSTAKLGFKYRLPPRIELVPLIATYVTCPLLVMNSPWPLVPGLLMSAFLSAIIYNDLVRKRKTLGETFVTFPLLLVYYHCRAAGYLYQWARLLVGRDQMARVDSGRAHAADRRMPS